MNANQESMEQPVQRSMFSWCANHSAEDVATAKADCPVCYRKLADSNAIESLRILGENQSLRKQLAEAKESEAHSGKLLCSLWDKLGAHGKIDEQNSAVERIRDLIVAEDERESLRAELAELRKRIL